MRQVLLIAAALGLSVTGCDFISGLTGGDSPPPITTAPVPIPVPGGSPSPGQPLPGQPSPGQTPTAQASPQGILPPDLISSTDSNQRVQQVKGNTRNDPFALLPTTPSVQLPPVVVTANLPPVNVSPGSVPAGAVSPGSVPGAGGRQPGSTASGAPNRTGTGRTAQSGAGAAGAGKNSGPRSPIAVPVPRPDPTLAKAVEVTGVVQIGSQAYAIVNAPNEPTSRYVQEGQRLAGGQVLVRRIDFNRAEPVVILEQGGVEVVRAVGESGAASLPPAGPAT